MNATAPTTVPSAQKQAEVALENRNALLEVLRSFGHVTEVHSEGGVTAFIINGNPQQRLNVRAQEGQAVVKYNCAEAKSTAISAALQASTSATPLEIQLEEMTR